MFLFKTKNYKKSVLSLSAKDKIFLNKQEKLLIDNIFNSQLHTKRLQGFPETHVFSFRITKRYRGIFRIEKDRIVLFAICHRKDIYKAF